MRKFKDQFVYLSNCASLRKLLINQVIEPRDKEFKVVISDEDSCSLVIVSLKADEEQVTTETLDMSSLSLSDDTPAKISSDKADNFVYAVTDKTKIIFSQIESDKFKSDQPLNGYSAQMNLLKKLIVDRHCSSLPRTILLTGPSGVGKSHAMKCLFGAVSDSMNEIKLNSSLMLAKSFEFEKLQTAFRNLIALQPSILFIDNLEDVSSDKMAGDKRLVGWLKSILDEFQALPETLEPVILVGATSRPELLDNSLRRPGRFDIEVEMPIPTPADRRLILDEALKTLEVKHTLEEKQIVQLADSAHGFTGADLKHLCRMALLTSDNELTGGDGYSQTLTFAKLSASLRLTKPSIMREISLENPKVFWTDIGGLHALRHLLEETVVWPVKHPQAFTRMGIEPPRGILMYGPPGCCKTMIGKALATESGLNFFSIKGPELFSKWVGESERAIREMFRKARAAAPSILFFDEIDALAAERGQTQSAVGDRVLAQLLTEIDGVEKLSQVAIIAATNRPDIVDKALLRPGRLDSMVYVPLPDLPTRKEIFEIHAKRMPLPVENETERGQFISELADKSHGYTGAEVAAICQKAGLIALGESLQADTVTREHFLEAFDRVKPRIGEEMIAFYEEFSSRAEELKRKK